MTTRVEGLSWVLYAAPCRKSGICSRREQLIPPQCYDCYSCQAGGVEEYISVPDSSGEINPFTLVAAQEAGADAVYKLGGAQAIAALAFGTESILAVDKIVGPGNIYVNLAKRMVLARWVLISRPAPAKFWWQTRRMLAWWPGTCWPRRSTIPWRSVCLTDSYQLAQEIDAKINLFLAQQERKNIIEESLAKNGGIVLLLLEEAWPLLTLRRRSMWGCISKSWPHLAKITNAGAIFRRIYSPDSWRLWRWPQPCLPTNRAARCSPWDRRLFKSSSFLYYSPRAIFQEGEYFEIIAGVEGLYAHARALQIRREKANEKRSSDCARDCGNQS